MSSFLSVLSPFCRTTSGNSSAFSSYYFWTSLILNIFLTAILPLWNICQKLVGGNSQFLTYQFSFFFFKIFFNWIAAIQLSGNLPMQVWKILINAASSNKLPCSPCHSFYCCSFLHWSLSSNSVSNNVVPDWLFRNGRVAELLPEMFGNFVVENGKEPGLRFTLPSNLLMDWKAAKKSILHQIFGNFNTVGLMQSPCVHFVWI